MKELPLALRLELEFLLLVLASVNVDQTPEAAFDVLNKLKREAVDLKCRIEAAYEAQS